MVKEFVNENGTTQTEVIPARVIYLNRTDTSYTLHGLSPFTTYRVNVSAIPPKKDYRPPASIYVTTDMHVCGTLTAPPSLATPKLYGVTDSGTIMVILPQASQEFGPISHYFLVVIPESQVANLTDPNAYHLSYDAVETSTSLFTELPPESRPYIAAKFIGQDVPYIFNLGDHQTFNGYLNRPLFKSRRYKVFLRAYVDSPSEPHLFGTSNMSSFLSLDMNPIPPGAIPSDRLISTATVLPPAQSGGSLWVIGPVTLALLLASSLAVFMYVRRRRTLRSGQGASTTFEPLVSSDAPVATPDLNELH
ncbi:unnamed protein product [Darwinula stevensoni]|uniref:Fibronectin type-III domain-containing protein n=1 Tax=Darwinula stevensoni TaxID=69355 RepID=A0A7R9FSF7_9CRUS|nr:unnamed protein product [Darwinula stevensoni]CAG0903422.1 unnamed protein product [Darwinula stevensoni]